MKALFLALGLIASPLAAEAPAGFDIYLLGEVHDNARHHATQAEWVAGIAPRAVVFEMLTPAQAGRITAALIDDPAALAEALEWEDSGWPAFALYHPIFLAAGGARFHGAGVPRDAARAAVRAGIVESFGAGDARRFGLDRPLPEAERDARLAHQAAAHCNALPEEMLPMMVDIQRLRDAELARAALAARDETGGPVVVITGNGHARRDWGVPVYLAAADPGLRVFALGQSEDGAIAGRFDVTRDAPRVARPDPCAAFAKD